MNRAKYNRQIKKLENTIENTLDEIASELFFNRVLPVLKENGLSFASMNGFPKFFKDDKIVAMPRKLYHVFDNYDDLNGNPIYWRFPDYNPKASNFSQIEIDSFRAKEISTNEAILSCMMAFS